jgi:hypothetical protein
MKNPKNYIKTTSSGDHLILFPEAKNYAKKFMKRDKQDGLKKTYYFHHVDTNQIMALDNEDMFWNAVEKYKLQNVMPYKVSDKNQEAVKLGFRGCKLHVFKKQGASLHRCLNKSGECIIDTVSIAFDYLPADDELTIAEVWL